MVLIKSDEHTESITIIDINMIMHSFHDDV